ncbi:MAG TPA: ATP-binding protein [Pyrinomonadaceae bacterium]|jgi:signal transduction histidine kinase/ActR/RegA family two-component response regulator|nr:ATP-binding protein [Pyrinomonadaceae bacterium]
MRRPKLFQPFVRAVIALGALVILCAALRLPVSALDLRFLALVAVTLGVTSRISIRIPRIESEISVSDTFIFLALLLYGGEAAILVAAAEGFVSSLRFCKQKLTAVFNAASMALATFATVSALHFFVERDVNLSNGFTANFISSICLIAVVQYAVNSGIVALSTSLKTDQPVWKTWRKHYLWTSITYFAGASAAGIIAVLINVVGSSALIIAAPIIFIVYFTYQTYLKNLESAAAQAEQAERHVHELSHYIAEQERIREQFSQIEKLSALGELASGVAHDFNNTLSGILGRAQLLLRTNDPEKIRRGLEIIIKTAEDGAKTVKRIQDFARQRRSWDFGPVAVDQLLLDVSEITRPRWKDRSEAAGVHISLELQIGSKASVRGDDSELREVLVNMVFNAVDAMPAGGTLTMSTEDADDAVILSISDTGTGMAQEVRSRIFDPFFTTKGKAGLGLGLAVSYGIISRHEGTIEVDSLPGRGTTFRIKLPAATVEDADAHAARESVTQSAPSITSQQIRILVVDDEVSVRELLHDILTGEGHQVALAASGTEALALFAAMKFDAVFTDIGMPGMSGWELANAIRELNSTIPLAVITGWGEAVGSGEQRAAQVDWVVTKPFTADRITELAHEASRRSREQAERLKLTFAA